MDIINEGNLIIKCINCEEVIIINCNELDLEIIETSERQMGRENHYHSSWEINCNCGHEITIEYYLSEYPVGSVNDSPEIKINGGDILEKCKFILYS